MYFNEKLLKILLVSENFDIAKWNQHFIEFSNLSFNFTSLHMKYQPDDWKMLRLLAFFSDSFTEKFSEKYFS